MFSSYTIEGSDGFILAERGPPCFRALPMRHGHELKASIGTDASMQRGVKKARLHLHELGNLIPGFNEFSLLLFENEYTLINVIGFFMPSPLHIDHILVSAWNTFALARSQCSFGAIPPHVLRRGPAFIFVALRPC